MHLVPATHFSGSLSFCLAANSTAKARHTRGRASQVHPSRFFSFRSRQRTHGFPIATHFREALRSCGPIAVMSAHVTSNDSLPWVALASLFLDHPINTRFSFDSLRGLLLGYRCPHSPPLSDEAQLSNEHAEPMTSTGKPQTHVIFRHPDSCCRKRATPSKRHWRTLVTDKLGSAPIYFATPRWRQVFSDSSLDEHAR